MTCMSASSKGADKPAPECGPECVFFSLVVSPGVHGVGDAVLNGKDPATAFLGAAPKQGVVADEAASKEGSVQRSPLNRNWHVVGIVVVCTLRYPSDGLA